MTIKASKLAIAISVVGPLTVAVTGGANAAPALSGANALKAAAPIAAQEAGLDHDLKERERELILATLRVTEGSRKLTAERLGISPRTLRHKLQQFKAAGVNVPRVHDLQLAV